MHGNGDGHQYSNTQTDLIQFFLFVCVNTSKILLYRQHEIRHCAFNILTCLSAYKESLRVNLQRSWTKSTYRLYEFKS